MYGLMEGVVTSAMGICATGTWYYGFVVGFSTSQLNLCGGSIGTWYYGGVVGFSTYGVNCGGVNWHLVLWRCSRVSHLWGKLWRGQLALGTMGGVVGFSTNGCKLGVNQHLVPLYFLIGYNIMV